MTSNRANVCDTESSESWSQGTSDCGCALRRTQGTAETEIDEIYGSNRNSKAGRGAPRIHPVRVWKLRRNPGESCSRGRIFTCLWSTTRALRGRYGRADQGYPCNKKIPARDAVQLWHYTISTFMVWLIIGCRCGSNPAQASMGKGRV